MQFFNDIYYRLNKIFPQNALALNFSALKQIKKKNNPEYVILRLRIRTLSNNLFMVDSRLSV
jgi:hypothetical protein